MTKPKRGNVFPRGWDDKKVHELIAHHEGQTDEEAAAEDEAAFADRSFTIMQIPLDLVPEVDELLVRRAATRGLLHSGRRDTGRARSGGKHRVGRVPASARQ